MSIDVSGRFVVVIACLMAAAHALFLAFDVMSSCEQALCMAAGAQTDGRHPSIDISALYRPTAATARRCLLGSPPHSCGNNFPECYL